jgi:hypothetical protein
MNEGSKYSPYLVQGHHLSTSPLLVQPWGSATLTPKPSLEHEIESVAFTLKFHSTLK